MTYSLGGWRGMKKVKGSFVFLLLIAIVLMIPGAATAATNSFSDVPADNGNAPFIHYLANKGLIKGFQDGTYRPATGLTRAEAAALLVRAAKLEGAVNTPAKFRDVPAGHWASNSIAAAASSGLIKGYADGTFRPEVSLTRAEGIAMFLRLSKQTAPAVKLPPLQDVGVDHWAAQPIAVAMAAGMAEKVGQNQFQPNASFTRGDLARALAVLLTRDPELYQTVLQGEINARKGTVTLSRSNSKFSIERGQPTKIVDGDIIYTGSDGEAEIVFPDGSGILIKENTHLIVKETKGRDYMSSGGKPNTAVEWLRLELKKGKLFGALASRYHGGQVKNEQIGLKGVTGYPRVASLHFQPGKTAAVPGGASPPWWQTAQNKRVKVKVDMPWGVASVRGTFWQAVVEESGRSRTTVLTGEAEVAAAGQGVLLSDGQSTEIISPIAPPLSPTTMSLQDKREWLEVKEWVLNRAEKIGIHLELYLALQQSQDPSTLLLWIQQALNQLERDVLSTRSSGGGGGGDPVIGTVEPVTAAPGPGSVSAGTAVALTTATQGATIYYTLDGTTPTTSSTLYTEPIRIDANVTIKAIAVKAGLNNSTVSTFAYFIEGTENSWILTKPYPGALTSDFRITLSESMDTYYYRIFTENHVPIGPITSVNDKVRNLSIVFNNFSDLEITLYGDSDGENYEGTVTLEGQVNDGVGTGWIMFPY